MAREILFKAKRADNGEWVEGFYFEFKGETYIAEMRQTFMTTYYTEESVVDFNMRAYEVEAETICQYTGLNDKNGKKIWENDIIRCGRNIIVTWDEHFASWCLTRKGWLYKHFFGESQNPEDCEVIGNIFDNPDLLEENHE